MDSKLYGFNIDSVNYQGNVYNDIQYFRNIFTLLYSLCVRISLEVGHAYHIVIG